MNNVVKGLAVSFSLATAPALADPANMRDLQASLIEGNTLGNYLTYSTEEKVLDGRTTERNRALVDKVLGITCEWVEKGRRVLDENAEFHTKDLKVEKIGCAESVDIPDRWQAPEPVTVFEQAFMQLTMQGMPPPLAEKRAEEIAKQIAKTHEDAVGTVYQHKQKPYIIREIIAGDDPHALTGMFIMHEWDLAQNKVCLKTAYEVEAGTGVLPVQDWGCFKMNQQYLQRIIAKTDMVPA